MKGIKREFSVARTPQQNVVAERKNRTLIENRVLVTKSHNKTPYELLIGISPNIEFMRPFGCHVTILNTLDHLGKFDGKVDEGFLVGYSVYSKEFRVFNPRTRKVKDNMHVNFLENKPNVAGSRLEWLFDIDSLTKSMNYELVSTGNQSNGDVGYVNACDIQGDVDEISSNDDVCQGNEIRIDSITHAINVACPSINTASNIIVAKSLNINTADSNHTNMPTLEVTGIFDGAFDDRDLGAEADTNNLDSSTIISSMGELTFLLGLQVKQKQDDIFISQDKYVAEILKKFGFSEVKTASTPMETSKPLLKDKDGQEVDVHIYISMIGSLMYLTSSRSDIMFVVCACARHQVSPKVSHLDAVKRIFRYLKGQPKLGIRYPKEYLFELEAYTDSDYAGSSLDMKSTTGGCQFLGCRLISWQCKKHTVVANSTTEAEYVAALSCCGQ
nr:uncharacterized mitochondrial protein AtMg00810-like [Tanacetum cinerariifolium]